VELLDRHCPVIYKLGLRFQAIEISGAAARTQELSVLVWATYFLNRVVVDVLSVRSKSSQLNEFIRVSAALVTAAQRVEFIWALFVYRPTFSHSASMQDTPLLARKPRKEDDPKVIGLWKIGRTIGKGSSGRLLCRFILLPCPAEPNLSS
jgi:hypothetical protein